MLRCLLLALAGSLCVPAIAFAQINTWSLSNVTFDDGTSATGFITYNFGASTILNWSVTVQQGTNLFFTPRTYDPSNSSPLTFDFGNGQNSLLITEFPPPGGIVGLRTFRVTPVSSLDGANGSVAINLATVLGGIGSVECFNCSPSRKITGGSLTLVSVPLMTGPTMIVLVISVLAVGSWILSSRMNSPSAQMPAD